MTNRRMVLCLVAGLLAMPGAARAWWNNEWTGRKQFTIDTSATGAPVSEQIGSAPILLRLHAGNFKFEAAKEDGSDLRLVSADDQTPLKYHIEKWDPLLGEALIWVGIPEIKPGARTQFWLYYNNPKAVSAEDVKGTYDSGTALIYHFIERGQPPRDYSVWGNQGLTAGASAEGALIGRGLRLDGTATVTVPAATSLVWAPGARMTWSAWIKPANASATGMIFSRRDGSGALVIGTEGGIPFVEIENESGTHRAAATTTLAAGTWHHVVVTAGEKVALYVDGAPAAEVAVTLPELNTTASLGADSPPAASGDHEAPRANGKGGAKAEQRTPRPGFKGELDELQISKMERSVGFIQVAAVSQGTDPGKFLVAGQDEESGSWSSGYLAVILKSVTLDGWVVIGLLAIMALVSWMVMADKSAYLGRLEKANARFTDRFRVANADMPRLVAGGREASLLLGDEKALRDSSLYRVFQIGAEEIRKRSDGTQPLRAEAIEAIRACLDAGMIRETQKLNRRLVLLTIAISGGPFLGLLGTVVGVMITFASIAVAGDVNVNAIAPGISAALVATVAGLAVAIPALFGYNWLLTRVKNASATMQVFVDEIVTRVAEAYSESATLNEWPPAHQAIVAGE